MLFRALFILLAGMLASVSPAAWAYEFAPIVAQFTPSGAGASRTFVIKNTHAEPIAIQIEVFQRSADNQGNEIRQPEFDNFIVTPPQLVLAPGQSQSIRAQWIGDPDPDIELAYRLVVEQLPIPYAHEDAGDKRLMDVSVGFRYEAALYVLPKEGSPNAELVASELARTDADEPQLRLTVRNTGKRRAILQNTVLTVRAGDRAIDLSGEAVSKLDNRNIIAGTQAVVDLPWPDGIPVGPVSVTMTADYYKN
ncbi:fimbria/pilus periplasmic chaperone [uncultured Hyphomonas sp.]|jgi:fimbrial chaperone protein|uniref:fimbrial biogenesis chaperone n=1 Tax=uncultured Hyphomonas sp. TaxID=225298 RepID=UPI0030D9FED9|tara:strand:- start:2446 stop:3198 length:753 start_codon:yes stop_codon:yes gene_type:complete